MIARVFDVAHGSANFVISPTGLTELVDLGRRSDWSPLDHIYQWYIPLGQRLTSLVLTHHHGDHLDDVYGLTTNRLPLMVTRRHLDGRYRKACENSNSTEGQQKADHFDLIFRSYNTTPSPVATGSAAWGIDIRQWSHSETMAHVIASTDNSMANCCSYVRLYDHLGTRAIAPYWVIWYGWAIAIPLLARGVARAWESQQSRSR